MVDWSTLEGFEWDTGNERKSELKHAVSATEAEQVFFNQPLLVVADGAHSLHARRWHALGTTDADRLLHISFTLRADGRLIRVISASDMHRKERNTYAQSH